MEKGDQPQAASAAEAEYEPTRTRLSPDTLACERIWKAKPVKVAI